MAGARGDSNTVWHGGHYNIVSGLDSLRSDELGWRKLERDDTGDTRDPGADNTSHVIITGHQAHSQQVGGCCQHPPTWVAAWIAFKPLQLMSHCITHFPHSFKDTNITPSLHSSSFVKSKFVFAVLNIVQSRESLHSDFDFLDLIRLNICFGMTKIKSFWESFYLEWFYEIKIKDCTRKREGGGA